MKNFCALVIIWMISACSFMGQMTKQAAGQAQQSYSETLSGKSTAEPVKSIGIGEPKEEWSEKVVPYHSQIEAFLDLFKTKMEKFQSNKYMPNLRCAYYGSSGKRNGKSATMGFILPQLYGYCYVKGHYVEVYTYSDTTYEVKDHGKQTNAWKAARYYEGKKYPENKYAVKGNMAIYFDKTNAETDEIRQAFLNASL